jgi:hypothetical protein
MIMDDDARGITSHFLERFDRYMDRSMARPIENQTLGRTLSLLAGGRTAILSLDTEFYSVLDDGGDWEHKYVSHYKNTAVFPRELGGLLLTRSADTHRWRYEGFFHAKAPLLLPSPGARVAHIPACTTTVTEGTRARLDQADERIAASCRADVNANEFYQLYDGDPLDPTGAELRQLALRMYQLDARSVAGTMVDVAADLRALLQLVSVSKLIIKEHVDIDGLHNMCALYGMRRPWNISCFDIAVANGLSRSVCRSAKLSEMFNALVQLRHDDSSSSTFLAELHDCFRSRGAHNPETDAYMALLVSIVIMQSMSWAMMSARSHACTSVSCRETKKWHL